MMATMFKKGMGITMVLLQKREELWIPKEIESIRTLTDHSEVDQDHVNESAHAKTCLVDAQDRVIGLFEIYLLEVVPDPDPGIGTTAR